jgi:hypothetical protein
VLGLFSLKKIGCDGSEPVSYSGSSFVSSDPDEPAAPAAAPHDAEDFSSVPAVRSAQLRW